MQRSCCSLCHMINNQVQSTFPFGLRRPPHNDLALSLPLILSLCMSLSLSRFLSFFPSFSSSSCWMDALQLSKVRQLVPQEIADLGWTLKKSQINVLYHYSHLNTSSGSSSQCHPEGKRCSTRRKQQKHEQHHYNTGRPYTFTSPVQEAKLV